MSTRISLRLALGCWLAMLGAACGNDQIATPPAEIAALAGDADAAVAPDGGMDVSGPDANTDEVAPGPDADMPEVNADTSEIDVGPDALEADTDALEADTDALEADTDTADAGTDTADPGTDTAEPDSDAAASGTDDVDAQPDVAKPQCTTDAACAVPTACHIAACVEGQCTLIAVPDGALCGDACSPLDHCAGGVCLSGQATNCDDGNPCTTDSCDGKVGCLHADAIAACTDGNACTSGDACSAGKCLPGLAIVNCDDGNACTDDACEPSVGCSHAGNSAPCKLADLCQSGTSCAGGACGGGAAVSCDDGNPCTTDKCDGATGLCQFTGNTAACEDGDGCTLGDTCLGGKCLPGLAKLCDDGNPCTADACDPVKGACTTTAKDGPCDDGSACTTGDACGGGLCVGGKALNCDDGNPCTDDACDAKSGCTHGNNTTACSVGDACELAQCAGGQCLPSGKKGCDDGNPCTANNCDAIKGCVFTGVADGTQCAAADGCMAVSLCQAAVCVAGKKADCDDANPCTSDTCDPKTGCLWNPNTASCEDGNKCTVGDACKNGKCVAGAVPDPKITCDDNNLCTDDACDAKAGCVHQNNTIACNDGNVCTSGDACAGGACKGGAALGCDDGKICTNDLCNAVTGACTWTAKSGACDDGNACTANDACLNGNCAPGSPKNCDDANPCTDDACDIKTAACTHAPSVAVATACDDGNACTGGDVCKGALCAGVAKPVKCDDGNVCTTDACDPKTGACASIANTAACDDGNKCAAGDLCDGKGTCTAGKNATCDDANVCTTDACEPTSGACTHKAAADGGVCDDGIACTKLSACKSGLCAPAQAECTLLADAFDCATKGAGWTLPKPFGYGVLWGVDQAPAVPDQAKYLCTLNYNDDKDYCDNPFAGDYCFPSPNLTTASPLVTEPAQLGAPHLSFDTFYELDGPKPGGTGFGTETSDVPLVVLRDDTTKAVIDQFTLSKSTTKCGGGPCQGLWRSIDLEIPKTAGKKFHVEFSLQAPTNQGNKGRGWFVDNLKVSLQFSAEQCANGLDDDGNGKIDCADPVCAKVGACP